MQSGRKKFLAKVVEMVDLETLGLTLAIPNQKKGIMKHGNVCGLFRKKKIYLCFFGARHTGLRDFVSAIAIWVSPVCVEPKKKESI
ncbi:MAG TPA: hypothetical protein DCE81_00985 [Cytophagales bacterium]|nr:hypothetical protein [Cytophagales bacterium]